VVLFSAFPIDLKFVKLSLDFSVSVPSAEQVVSSVPLLVKGLSEEHDILCV